MASRNVTNLARTTTVDFLKSVHLGFGDPKKLGARHSNVLNVHMSKMSRRHPRVVILFLCVSPKVIIVMLSHVSLGHSEQLLLSCF